MSLNRPKLFRSLSLTLTLALLTTSALTAAGDTTRVSVASDGTQGNSFSYWSSISADGRYVAFYSGSSNLVSGDTNASQDIFVRDRQTNTTTLVSVASDGTQGNNGSDGPFITADGRYVGFYSLASNLVSGDTNNGYDVFVHDRQTNTTTRVSIGLSGVEANGDSFGTFISADGRYVAFQSRASNLVSGDTNGLEDIFVYDRQTNTTTRVSVASDGSQGGGWLYGPSMSADGRYVTFVSGDDSLVSGDTNGCEDILVRDRQANTTTRVSVDSSGAQGYAGARSAFISADGRYVAFQSDASNMVSGDTNEVGDIFLRDRQTNTTTRVSVASDGTQGNNGSGRPTISADGRYVVFSSGASNLVSGDTNGVEDIFVRDRQTNTTTRVSVASDGTQGNGPSVGASLSADGRYVAFDSDASNLVSGDTNGSKDIFVHENDRTPPTVTAITRASPSPTNAASVSFIVTFSEPVTGVDMADFTLTTPGISGAAVTGVSGGPTDYSVTANTGAGSGTLRLDIVSVPSIQDLAGNPLAGPYSSGETYTIDKIAPSVRSITRTNANPTGAGSVNFIVIFSEPVTGVDPSDFTLTTTGISGAAITDVSGGPAPVYIVTVSTGMGDGTLRLDVSDNDSIVNAAGNPLGGAGAGNGDFTDGEAYDVYFYRIYLPSVLRNQP